MYSLEIWPSNVLIGYGLHEGGRGRKGIELDKENSVGKREKDV